MATNTNLLEYSKQLALKLRDPVADGAEDGKTFSAALRFGYLTRGFGKMIRNLEALGYEIENIYPQYFTAIDKYFKSTTELQSDPSSPIIEISLNNFSIPLATLLTIPSFRVFKIIAKGRDTSYRGRSIRLSNAFETLYGLPSVHYNPENVDTAFYFYTSDGIIKILANTTMKVTSLHFLIKNPLIRFAADSGSDLYLPVEMDDLLLTYSSLEASNDTGNTVKVNLYRGEVNQEISMIGVGLKNQASKEKTDVVDV